MGPFWGLFWRKVSIYGPAKIKSARGFLANERLRERLRYVCVTSAKRLRHVRKAADVKKKGVLEVGFFSEKCDFVHQVGYFSANARLDSTLGWGDRISRPFW